MRLKLSEGERNHCQRHPLLVHEVIRWRVEQCIVQNNVL